MKCYYERRERGFTLIELLVVVSVVALLASIILASVKNAQAKARDSKRVQDIVQVKNGLELYSLDHAGKYPNRPIDVYFTSRGLNTQPVCPETGSSWTDNDANGYAAQFVSGLRPYIQLPTDPINSAEYCYIYAGEPSATLESGSSAGAFYGQNELGLYQNQTVGVVVGNQTGYEIFLGVPSLALLVGSGTTTPSGSGSTVTYSCQGTPSCLDQNGQAESSCTAVGSGACTYSPGPQICVGSNIIQCVMPGCPASKGCSVQNSVAGSVCSVHPSFSCALLGQPQCGQVAGCSWLPN